MEPENLFHKLPKELNGLLLSGLKYIYLLKKDKTIFGAFYSLQDALFASLENNKVHGIKEKNIYDEETNTWTYAYPFNVFYSYHIQEIEVGKFIDMDNQTNEGDKIIYVVVGYVLVKLTTHNYNFEYTKPVLDWLYKHLHDSRMDLVTNGNMTMHNTFRFNYPPLNSFRLPEIPPDIPKAPSTHYYSDSDSDSDWL